MKLAEEISFAVRLELRRWTPHIGRMETKLAKLKAAAAANDWAGALAIAARFGRLGAEGPAIKRAHECMNGGARFYAQIGRDPEALIAAGVAALRSRYRIADVRK